MFYEILGPLLRLAGKGVVARGHYPRDDEYVQKELRKVGVLMQRVGTAWPALFRGAAAENEILLAAAERVCTQLADRGLALPARGRDPAEGDALLERRRLLEILDDAIVTLHAAEADAAWRRQALADVRGALGEAARVQLGVIDGILPRDPTGERAR